MLETAGKNILVDPGILSFDENFLDNWKKADCVLITHKHSDHCHAEIIKNISAPIYSSAEVASAYPHLKIKIVKIGDVLRLADGIRIDIVGAIHGWMPFLKHNKIEIHENIGFIIHAENKKVWFTSDTLCFDNDYKCDVLCAPVSGHGLVMGAFELSLFAKECDPDLVLPCHMDNPKFPVDIKKMEDMFATYKINYRVLGFAESTDL
jgi:L-ascorbate metabolism protein UlaG (beta-lactamase superfamily)